MPIIRETNCSSLKAVRYSNGNRVETRDLPAAVSGGLVRDLPDAVDPEQIVEVDPPTGLVGVKAKLDRGSISHLSHRDESTHNARTGRRRPFLKAVGDQIFMKDAVGVDVEDPGVFVKSLLQLADIIVIECIDVELHNSNDLVVVICSRSHGDLLLFNPTFPICRSTRPI